MASEKMGSGYKDKANTTIHRFVKKIFLSFKKLGFRFKLVVKKGPALVIPKPGGHHFRSCLLLPQSLVLLNAFELA